ncbi:MAG: TIGR04076 family protein [Nitrososphaerales archaeon]
MTQYKVRIVVKEIVGTCDIGYKVGDKIDLEKYYVREKQECRICLHALVGISTLLIPFMKGVSAKALGIGKEDDIGYIHCPDPGKPYTEGGTVLFELKREKIEE